MKPSRTEQAQANEFLSIKIYLKDTNIGPTGNTRFMPSNGATCSAVYAKRFTRLFKNINQK